MNQFGKVLPNRKHIILTKNKEYKIANDMVEVVTNINDIKEYIEGKEENFIIGGASIYKMLMPYTQKMYITKIDEEFVGDTYFPEIDEEKWKITEVEERNNR